MCLFACVRVSKDHLNYQELHFSESQIYRRERCFRAAFKEEEGTRRQKEEERKMFKLYSLRSSIHRCCQYKGGESPYIRLVKSKPHPFSIQPTTPAKLLMAVNSHQSF